jgi:aryl-alcohol dehydrogenase-like predicted oxidoreductase
MMRPSARKRLPSFRDRLRVRDTGLIVSPFCLGIADDPHVIVEAFERGINFFFVTADMHWPMYEGTRRGIRDLLRTRRGIRDEIVVAAVSYVAQPSFLVQPFCEVIDSIPGLERLDMTIVGGVGSVEEVEAPRFAAFAKHLDRERSRIPGVRAIGATFHSRAAAATSLAKNELDLAFIRYNACHRGSEHDLFPRLHGDSDTLLFSFKSTLGYVPPYRFEQLRFAPDAWRPRVSDQYRFVLSRAELDGILCAPQAVAELDALAEALDEGPLSPEQLSYMKTAADLHFGRIRAKQA